MKKLLNTLSSFVIVGLMILSVLSLFLQPCIVAGRSMIPSLQDNEKILLIKKRAPERFDVAIFTYNGKYLIKRVIGLPYETVEYIDNKLYINGNEIDDPYNSYKMKDTKVELKNEYYVLGDNREISADSRYIGPISASNIIASKLIAEFN